MLFILNKGNTINREFLFKQVARSLSSLLFLRVVFVFSSFQNTENTFGKRVPHFLKGSSFVDFFSLVVEFFSLVVFFIVLIPVSRKLTFMLSFFQDLSVG